MRKMFKTSLKVDPWSSFLHGSNVLDADQGDGYVLVVYHVITGDRRSFVDDPAELDRF